MCWRYPARDTCETCIASIPEIYNPTTNSWTALTTAPFSVALYPFMFVLPDGRVLEAGATRAAVDTRVLDLTTNTWTVIDPTSAGRAFRRHVRTRQDYEIG